jgi:methionine-R-sulfoxide reductase
VLFSGEDIAMKHNNQEDKTNSDSSSKNSEINESVCFIQPTEELRKKLSKEQYEILVHAATEPPFHNKYWDNHEPGIYVDAISGIPLFSSQKKFDSGTGWPSFWEPIDPSRLALQEDKSFGMTRIEVRAKDSGGHLGHLFEDGPLPSRKRYCINSGALKFIPVTELAAKGYEDLVSLFTSKKL